MEGGILMDGKWRAISQYQGEWVHPDGTVSTFTVSMGTTKGDMDLMPFGRNRKWQERSALTKLIIRRKRHSWWRASAHVERRVAMDDLERLVHGPWWLSLTWPRKSVLAAWLPQVVPWPA